MTMHDAEIICPACLSSAGTMLSDGRRLCFDCRHEWNPADETADLTRDLDPASAIDNVIAFERFDATARAVNGQPSELDDVLGPPADVAAMRDAQARLDAIVGRLVELEGGQYARVVDFPDDDHVTVNVTPDAEPAELVTVELGDVVREVPEAPADVDVPDEVALALAQTVVLVAGMTIDAGLASLEGERPNVRIVLPPAGWMPVDVEALPIIEQAVAYAVACLVHAFELDPEIVAAVAQTLITDARGDG